MPEIDKTQMGGTMRIGARTTYIKNSDSLASRIHGGATQVTERHRH